MTDKNRVLAFEKDLLALFKGILLRSTNTKTNKEKFEKIVKEGMKERNT